MDWTVDLQITNSIVDPMVEQQISNGTLPSPCIWMMTSSAGVFPLAFSPCTPRTPRTPFLNIRRTLDKDRAVKRGSTSLG